MRSSEEGDGARPAGVGRTGYGPVIDVVLRPSSKQRGSVGRAARGATPAERGVTGPWATSQMVL